jgi:hypothetical protein
MPQKIKRIQEGTNSDGKLTSCITGIAGYAGSPPQIAPLLQICPLALMQLRLIAHMENHKKVGVALKS